MTDPQLKALDRVMVALLEDIRTERYRRHDRFGQQDIPDGTGWFGSERRRDLERLRCDRAFLLGKGTYAQLLEEEVAEALAESDPAKLRAELVQVAAVVIQWIEAIDRRPKGDSDG